MNTPEANLAARMATLPREIMACARAMPEAGRMDVVASAMRPIVSNDCSAWLRLQRNMHD
ncbi:MAG TPA: hypothetical protein VMV97_06765 [Sulfuriferula sp.]|nr:hypothetical protein [Sulfuriferula sp.]